jgi:HK97 family phage major capsid protein
MEEKRKRIEEINKRISALDTELDTADSERIDAIGGEVKTLKAEREELTRSLAQEARKAFASGTPVATGEVGTDESITRMSRREKICLVVGRQARRRSFSDAERRALGTALTTTSTTYTAASAITDGVNNAGIFIPTTTILEFLREDSRLSPILSDVSFMAVPGLIEFPYRKSRDKARSKAEGAEGRDNQMEWDKLTAVKGYLQTIIAVTDEVQALTDFDFGAYILSQILQDLNEDWVFDILYGAGNNDHIKGITVDAISAVSGGYEYGKVIEALITGVKKCVGKFRRGAKIYVAQDVADEILFSTDDNGNFKYPIFNNSTGITSFGSIRIEVDENLTAGDFVIGNVNKFYKINSLIPIRVETNRIPRRGVTEYIASEYCASAIYPSAFVYGQKK